MVIYEVNLEVAAEIYQDYYKWILEHINQMLSYDGFKNAEIGIVEQQEKNEKINLRVSYLIESYEHLQKYLREYAPKMRADGIQKFGDKFNASRRVILEPIMLNRKLS